MRLFLGFSPWWRRRASPQVCFNAPTTKPLRWDIIVLILLGIVAGGCVPEQYTIRPGAMGMVTDVADNSPLPGATVTVDGPLKWNGRGYSSSKNTGHVQAVSDKDGRFSIAALSGWRPHPSGLSKETAPPTSRVTVEKPGYESKKIFFETNGVTDVGTIALQKRK